MFRRIGPLLRNLNRKSINAVSTHKFSLVSVKCETLFPIDLSYPSTIHTRTFAKGKDKKKDKGKNKKVIINENEIAEVLDVEKLKAEMCEAINTLRHDFIHKVSLRSTTSGIDTLRFSYKGEKIDLLEVAKVNRSNTDIVVIDMTSASHLLPTVLKVIATSGMNLNPHQEGSSIIIPIPQVTQQYKEGLSKNAKAMFVKCKDLIKESQNKYLKILKSKSKDGISDDLIHRVSDQIVFMGNIYIADAEKLLQKKQEELTD